MVSILRGYFVRLLLSNVSSCTSTENTSLNNSSDIILLVYPDATKCPSFITAI